jgi:hypothetical protein
MICDHVGCNAVPTRGPRLIVPAKNWLLAGHKAVRMMTSLHYCELHRGDVKVSDLLRPNVKAEMEALAKRKRPLDFRLDFEAAFIEHVLVTTPEYRKWMSGVDISKLLRLAA